MAENTRERWSSPFTEIAHVYAYVIKCMGEGLYTCGMYEMRKRQLTAANTFWNVRWPYTLPDGRMYLYVCHGVYEWKLVCYRCIYNPYLFPEWVYLWVTGMYALDAMFTRLYAEVSVLPRSHTHANAPWTLNHENCFQKQPIRLDPIVLGRP